MSKEKTVILVDDWCLHYQVELAPEEMKRFARLRAGGCPSFFEDIIDEINSLLQQKNMNHRFRVGREGSRVLYLYIIKAYLPKDFNYKNLGRELSTLAKKHGCDEYGVKENTTAPFSIDRITGVFNYRFWWD